MIALLLPWIFGGALLAALAVGVLHLLSVQRPPEIALPTARFLPDRQVRAVSRTKRPSDLLLMLVRMTALILAGLAAASPVWRSTGASTVALAVIDGGIGPASDTTALSAMIAADRTVFAFVGSREGDLAEFFGASQSANESAVWPEAWRSAATILAQQSPSDSLTLHLFVRHADDVRSPGALAWASTWPGLVIVHSPRVDRSADSVLAARKVVVVLEKAKAGGSGRSVGEKNTMLDADDGVVAALEWHAARISASAMQRGGALAATDTVYLSRANVVDANATAFSSPANRVRIEWPQNGVPRGWSAYTPADSAVSVTNALVAAGEAMVAPFIVSAMARDTAAGTMDIAWWGDGRVAAREQRTPSACRREVAVVVVDASDVLLGDGAIPLFNRLLAPCRTEEIVTASALTTIDTLRNFAGTRGDGAATATSEGLAENGSLASVQDQSVREFAKRANISLTQQSRTVVVPVLLALALLLLVVEGRLRAHQAADNRVANAQPPTSAKSAAGVSS